MITFGYDCPYCAKKDVAFTIRYIASNVADTGKYRGETIHNVFATCNHCFHGITAIYFNLDSERYVNGMPSANGLAAAVNDNVVHFINDIFAHDLTWFPEAPKPDIPEYLPENVLKKYRAAETLFIQAQGDSDLVEFAGNAYRAALEFGIDYLYQGSEKNLSKRIKALSEQGVLVKSMESFAHRVRVLGNSATHDEISLDELSELRLFTSLFLKYTFTLPAMIPKGLNQS